VEAECAVLIVKVGATGIVGGRVCGSDGKGPSNRDIENRRVKGR